MAIPIPQPGQKSSQRIAVWEYRPWWTPRLQHRFSDGDVAVRGFRGTQDLIDAAPGVVVFDASVEAEAAIRSAAEIVQRRTGVFVVFIVSQELRAMEWRLRDLGADVVVGNDVSSDELAEICRRALRTVPNDRSWNSSGSN